MLACPELESACLLLLIGHAARRPADSSLVGSTLSAVAAVLGYLFRSAYTRLLARPLLHGWFDAGNTLQDLLDAKVRPPTPAFARLCVCIGCSYIGCKDSYCIEALMQQIPHSPEAVGIQRICPTSCVGCPRDCNAWCRMW